MGSTQSILTPDVVVAGALVVGTVTAASYGAYSRSSSSKASSSSSPSSAEARQTSKKKKKNVAEKEKAREDAAFNKALADANKTNLKGPTQVVPFPSVVPGTFDSEAAASILAPTPQKPSAKKAKKKTKRAGTSGTEEQLEETQAKPAPPVFVSQEAIPTPEPATKTSSKKKKRKGTKAAAAVGKENARTGDNNSTSTKGTGGTARSQALAESYILSDAPEDASWTRVTSRRRNGGTTGGTTDVDLHTSDTNATRTTSATADTTEDDGDAEEEKPADTPRRTLAERMLPRPRKTGVEDMEEESLQPTIARVMRVHPATGEVPAKGFSWGDYENYAPEDSTSADGDADDAWEEVKSKRRTKPNQGQPPLASSLSSSGFVSNSGGSSSAPTKKQRQNAKRAEAVRSAKEAAEQDRLARLAAYKRELEKTRMAEQQAAAGRKKAVSGGMKAVVDTNGKLVWE